MLGKIISPRSTYQTLSPQLPVNSELEAVYFRGSLDVLPPPSSVHIELHDRGGPPKVVCTPIGADALDRPQQSEGPFANYKEVRQVITQFLDRCNIPFHVTPYDHQFHDACVEEAVRRGYPLDTPTARGHTLRAFLPQGTVMSMTAYAHLEDEATRIYIALYTALLIYLDDVFKDDVETVSEFNEHFIQGQQQGNSVFDALADVLRETPQHFGLVVSNLIIAATLNLITALPLERESLSLNVSHLSRS